MEMGLEWGAVGAFYPVVQPVGSVKVVFVDLHEAEFRKDASRRNIVGLDADSGDHLAPASVNSHRIIPSVASVA